METPPRARLASRSGPVRVASIYGRGLRGEEGLMDECDGIPPGWRGIVEDVGAGVMRAAAACAGPCSAAFEFELVAGRLAVTWGCRPAPAPLRRRMVAISAEAHRRSAVICEACGEAGDRSAGRTLCVRHRADA